MSKIGAMIVPGSFLVLAACSSKTPPLNEKVPSSNTNQADSGAEEKYGLSEAARQQICEALEQLWLQALGQASEKYPSNILAELFADEKRQKKIKQQTKKRAKLFRTIMDGYLSEMAKKYNLSSEQLADIAEEGIEKGWRKYPPPRTPIYK